MEDYGLNRQQLFQLKRGTLEKRVNNYFKETHDGNGTIQLLLVLQVRDELCEGDFSLLLKDLVQYIFLHTRSSATMRRFYHYFAGYFDKKEWCLLSLKLFPAKNFITEKIKALYSQIVKEPLVRLVES
ncbi:hypothetical protein [Enterococcus sp. DIV0170]|uniref:hypothetical protein n=1 Tax=Enterococcus sp. DIV0170 TaxID=2774642 RepID=UPI003F25BDF8